MPNYLSDQQYIALKVEAIENTPITPDVFLPLINEGIVSDLGRSPDERIAGLDWKSDDLLKGRHLHGGPVELYADPDTLGHILNMFYKKGNTVGDAAVGYTHPFTAADPKSYTIEIAKGLYAQRYWGVKADNLKLDFDNNKLKATIDIKAVGQFSTATLAVALTGAAMTEAVFNQDYILRPTEGLVNGDVVVIGGVDLTITSVDADGVTIGFGATTVTSGVGGSVYLKKQTYVTPDPALQDPLFEGNTLIGVGVDETAATTASGAKATATPFQEFVIELKNNLFEQAASGQHDPIKILPKMKEGRILTKKLFADVDQHRKWIDKTKQAITLISKGRFIKTDRTTWDELSFKFHKVKLNPNSNPLDVGEYIYDNQEFDVLYDRTDVKAITLSLVNRTAGTAYGD